MRFFLGPESWHVKTKNYEHVRSDEEQQSQWRDVDTPKEYYVLHGCAGDEDDRWGKREIASDSLVGISADICSN